MCNLAGITQLMSGRRDACAEMDFAHVPCHPGVVPWQLRSCKLLKGPRLVSDCDEVCVHASILQGLQRQLRSNQTGVHAGLRPRCFLIINGAQR